jgi:uncharacterized protein YcfL
LKELIAAVAAAALLSGCSSAPKVADVEPPETGLSETQLTTWVSNQLIAGGIDTEVYSAHSYTFVACSSLGSQTEPKTVSQLVEELDRIDGVNEEQAQIIVAASVRGVCPEQLGKWESYLKAG